MFLIISLMTAVIIAEAQIGDKDIPSDITSSLAHKYPEINIDNVNWHREGSNYKAVFAIGAKDYVVLFDDMGQWLSSEVDDMTFAELPEDVKTGLDEGGYDSDKLRDIEMAESPDGAMYKIEVKDGRRRYHDVYLNKEGNIIKDDI